MKKLTKKTFIDKVITDGYVSLGENGRYRFVVVQVNEENIKDMPEKLKIQLEEENLYNSWVGIITDEQAPYSIYQLPIFGDKNRYVTKWLSYSSEDAADDMLRDRQIKLLTRANEYIENNEQ